MRWDARWAGGEIARAAESDSVARRADSLIGQPSRLVSRPGLVVLSVLCGCSGPATATRADAASTDAAVTGPGDIGQPEVAGYYLGVLGNACIEVTSSCGPNAAEFMCGSEAMPSGVDCPSIQTLRSGERTLCCQLGPERSTCAPDARVSCPENASGYTCTGWDTPAQADNLICNEVSGEDGSRGYCCRRYVSTACRFLMLGHNCVNEYAFLCDAFARPEQSDPELWCDGQDTDGSGTYFCCAAHRPVLP